MTITIERDARRILRRREQERHCRRQLSQLLRDHDPITTDTARLIAACIHRGPGTSLERFAATGDLDTPQALIELEACRVPSYQTRWVVALWEYLEARDNSEPPDAIDRSPRSAMAEAM